MKMMKRLLCAVLALALLPVAAPSLAEPATVAAPVEYVHDDKLTLLTGSCVDAPVTDMADAARVVEAMRERLGADPRAEFDPVRTLTDLAGNRYYVFQQTYADTIVLGGAVKVVTDKDGNMLGLSASVEAELPDIAQVAGISAAEAEARVIEYGAQRGHALSVVEGQTAEVILPLLLSVDDEENSTEACRFVWVVYTDNPAASVEQGSDLPYLAHYVTTAGEYLYSLPTILPGDAAGQTGFDTSYVFEFMEPAEYTGYVDLADGTEKEVTVTLMRDKRTGMYYLGNIERRIVVADCHDYLYNHGQVRLCYSPDNRQWDQVGLMSLYNYCRVWDYYDAIGWIGGDGKRTPIMVLNDYCDADHTQVDNACYMGYVLGWQIFGASQLNSYSQCLDVIAHEFTHCVTQTTLTYNSYLNDYGAINEAISDIQGNICEMLLGDTDDTTWLLGEHSLEPVRSMSDPHAYGQPEYSWDLYYKPAVLTATPLNDQGGVHTNSSLLNNVAYRLCAKGGMTLEEARAYWYAVDCSMVPGTDYAQLSELLPWVMEIEGYGRYSDALRSALDATRMGDSAMPDTFDADRAMVTLKLPDSEVFTDGNWALYIVSVDTAELVRRFTALMDQVKSGDTAGIPPVVVELLSQAGGEGAASDAEVDIIDVLIDVVFEILFSEDPEESAGVAVEESMPEITDSEYDELIEWSHELLNGLFYNDVGAAGQDGRTVYMMCRPGRTIPLLVHMRFDENSEEPDQVTFAFLFNGRWYDMGALLSAMNELGGDEEEGEDDDPSLFDLLGLFKNADIVSLITPFTQVALGLKSPEALLKEVTFEIRGGEVCEIPDKGLKKVTLPEKEDPLDYGDEEAAEYVPGKLSRPKETA